MGNTSVNSFWPIVFCLTAWNVGRLSTSEVKSICGDWTPYKDEKCLKIADRAGPQTQYDGEVVCKAYADGRTQDSSPKLLTIKTAEEQEFVQRYLFEKNEMVDHVWLGLTKHNSSFVWNDESKLTFANWANQTLSDDQHQCVQMQSNEGVLDAGLWYKVSCRRKNAIVCERRPTMTFEALQNAFLDFKLKQEMLQKKWELKEKEWRDQMTVLKNNPVPASFIYVQSPDQDPPTSLWPMAQWMDVSSVYAGLFFRVVGEMAAPFGQTQEENCSQLVVKHSGGGYDSTQVTVPSNGSWSKKLATSTYVKDMVYESVQFRVLPSELRPRNKAVKVWKRL